LLIVVVLFWVIVCGDAGTNIVGNLTMGQMSFPEAMEVLRKDDIFREVRRPKGDSNLEEELRVRPMMGRKDLNDLVREHERGRLHDEGGTLAAKPESTGLSALASVVGGLER